MSLASRFLLFFCASLIAGAVFAADEPSVGTPPATAEPGQPAVIEVSGTSAPAKEAAPELDAARTARRAAFDAVINAQSAKIRELTDRLATTVGDDAIMALQDEIAREKMATQRQLLELQLEMAVREVGPEGDRTRIEKLEAALAAWDAPRPVLQPVDRPAPANPGR